MKVTAIIDDDTIKEALKYSKATTITDALRTALAEYITSHKLKELGEKIKKQPLTFGKAAKDIRKLNRQR